MEYRKSPRWRPAQLSQAQPPAQAPSPAPAPSSPPTGFTPPVEIVKQTPIVVTSLAGSAVGAVMGLLYGVVLETNSMKHDALVGGVAGLIAATLARVI